MTEKLSYNPEEFAAALGVNVRKIYEMLRNDEIEHIHINKIHREARIPHREFERLVKVIQENS